jgi:3-(3-hydroxy-phenyl)propionate hydroxylase
MPAAALDCEVAIVGYGPVGVLLANLLGRDGIRTAVFEREREVYRLPRAVHFDHEVMRIFQSLGLAEILGDESVTDPILGYEFLNADREILFCFDLAQGVTHQGWRPDYMFHQPSLESTLREAAAKRESIAVHLERELVALEEHEGHVELGVRDTGSGEEQRVRARFVVGADGANSVVRNQAGLTLDDLEFDEPWLVVDAKIQKQRADLGLPMPCVQLCDPARPVTFVPVTGPYIRWEFMLKPGEKKEEMLQPERVRALIGEWTDPNEVEVIRSAVYDFHALVAERWNTRRIFLAGDSAHQTPPFLGQGMCAGMRDAANLAWKLGLVLRGAAPAAILDSYQTEREPQVRALIGIAIDMGRIICTQDPAAAAARDADFLSRPERTRQPPDFPAVGPGLHQLDSKLAGRLGLQARVRASDGTEGLLDDVMGPGFALLTRGPEPPVLREPAMQVLEKIGGRVMPICSAVDLKGVYAAWFDRHGCDAVLVRPDHIVYGTSAGSEAASELLEELGRALATDLPSA